LGKLYEVGTRMMYIDNLLEESWKRILKMNLDVPPNLMMIYSRYLVDILYDKESAEEVLDRLKNFYSVNMDRGKITNNINDFPNESTALISISAEDMTFARIIGLNMSASKMFGYSKSELISYFHFFHTASLKRPQSEHPHAEHVCLAARFVLRNLPIDL
jgi:hypothetical protein